MGIVCMVSVVGIPAGIGLIIGGIVYIMVGKNYNDIQEIKKKMGS